MHGSLLNLARPSDLGRKLTVSRGWPAVTRSYGAWITGQVIIRFLVLVVLLEGLFLSEHFLDILRGHADEVGSIFDLLLLVTLSAPEVQFALPIVTLVAVYLVVLKQREDRELIALAASGVGTRQILSLAFVWGVAALSSSLLITGVVLPHSKFIFRSDLYASRIAAIRSGGATDHFYTFPSYTIFKWPNLPDTKPSPLFVYQKRDGGTTRLISADSVRVLGDAQTNMVNLQFNEVEAIDLLPANRRTEGPPTANSHADNTAATAERQIMRAETYAQAFDLEQFWRLEPRGISPTEWSTVELLGLSPEPSGTILNSARYGELLERLARSLLCLIAPFIALLTVEWTNRTTKAFALGVACSVILCLDVLDLVLARTLSSFDLSLGSGSFLGLFAGVAAIVVWQIYLWQSELVRPALSKA